MILQNNSKNIYPNGYSSGPKIKTQNSLNFSGPRLPHQTFEEFEKFAKETDFLNNLPNILENSNPFARGGQYNVYNIPNNDTFLLRISKKLYIPKEIPKQAQLKKAVDAFPNNNLGQKVAKIGEQISVIIKQSGEPNGIEDWQGRYWQPYFSKSLLPEFIDKLKTVAGMNQEAYNTLGEEVKLIVKKKKSFDYFNPQNVLIDKQNQAFNIVDVEENEFRRNVKLNSHNCILHSLLDEQNFMKAYKASNEEQQKEITIAAKEIRDKTKISANKNSLSHNDFLFRSILKITDEGNYTGGHYLQKHKEFQKFINNL